MLRRPPRVGTRGSPVRRDEPHVGRVRLGEDRGGRALVSARSTASRSFHGTTSVSFACAAVTPGDWPGCPASPARAGVGQQAVHVAVVGARELQDRVAAGGGSRQADRAHRRLGPDEVMRTISALGTGATISAASSTSPSVGAPNLVPRAAAS